MAYSLAARSATSSCVVSAARSSNTPVRPSLRSSLRSAGKTQAPSRSIATKVAFNEIAQVAGEVEFIGGTAVTMFAITVLGLAVGFVLLRVEALVEEGKI